LNSHIVCTENNMKFTHSVQYKEGYRPKQKERKGRLGENNVRGVYIRLVTI